MECISALAATQVRLGAWRLAQERIALVPTMGNLHRGHLELVTRAHELGDRTVVSVFVNPLQFSPEEDYDAYPRTLERDQRALSEAGVDLLFAPSVHEVYPSGQAEHTQVNVPGLSDILCGASRPGHFGGVATVVCKLFNLVQPDVGVFGEKDFQQLLVIRRMAADLCLPIEIVGVATVREADGLALSSRNAYLAPAERERAPTLYRSLCHAARALAAGARVAEVERQGHKTLQAAGFKPDYFHVCRAADLTSAEEQDRELVVLAAAYLGQARLIDNLRITR